MSCAAAVFGLLLSSPLVTAPSFYPVERRNDLVWTVAEVICSVARTPTERKFLIVQTLNECAMLDYVLMDRCDLGPDWACDHGHATGPWQVHRNPLTVDAWNPLLTNLQRFESGARFSLLVFRMGLRQCGTLEGGFAHLGGGGACVAEWARERVQRMGSL